MSVTHSELAGRSALVTGASRGIGAATAEALARHGVARVLIHYGSYLEGAERTLAAVRGHGADGDLFRADLTGNAGIQSLTAQIRDRGATIDILVNNAGSLIQRAKLAEFTPELFDRLMNLNVKSAYSLSQVVAPHMANQGSGSIINLSSIAARTGGGPGASIYAAAKAAVSAMTKGLALELAPLGIRVNAVSPGTVDNHFHEQFSTRERLEKVRDMTPAGTLGTSEEIADTIIFLCSRAARFIHGQTIEVNGGAYMI